MTTWQDIVNGSFELFGAPFIFLSVIKLYKDKLVKGVSWVGVGFFASWGYWNLYFYPHLNQWASFFGGIAIVLCNTIWLIQLLYYIKYPGGKK